METTHAHQLSETEAKLVNFITVNKQDLAKLGLFFLRLLHADVHTVSTTPSATLALVLGLDMGRSLTTKELDLLFSELESVGLPPLTDGFGKSILRM